MRPLTKPYSLQSRSLVKRLTCTLFVVAAYAALLGTARASESKSHQHTPSAPIHSVPQTTEPPQPLSHYLRFGILPLQSPTKLAAMFMPLAENLQQALGTPVQFVTAPSFSRYMTRVKQRDYDIIYLNPLTYTEARKAGYRVIAKVAQEPFTGILVVRKDGPIKDLDPQHLAAGLRLGFPDPNAFAATVMTRQYMQNHGIDVNRQFRVHYFGSQDSALMALYSGLVDIIGTWRPSLRSMPAGVRKELRIIAETPPQPQMPIAVRDTMSKPEIQRIQQCLLGLTRTDEGRKALAALGFKNGFVEANDAEYLGVH